MAALELIEVCKSFGRTPVVRDVSLSVEDGEFLVLVGPSGCGKSTLLNLIAGLEPITQGEVRIAGRSVNDVPPMDRDIAMVFQSHALYPNMTVARNFSFGLKTRGIAKPERDAAAKKVAALLQIEALLERKPGQLSGGQRQRVAMGRAMVRDPSIFLFDEPLSHLDARLRQEMRTEIKRLHRRLGRSAVYVTHDQIEAMTLASRIAVMHDGALQQCADPRTVYERPANLFVADFIGSPAMNLVRATLIQRDDTIGVHLGQEGGEQAFFPLAQPNGRHAEWLGREVVYGLRPEHLRPAASGGAGAAQFEGRVDVVEPTGNDTMVFLDWAGARLVARIPADRPVAPGERLRLQVDTRKASLFDPTSGLRI